ncbi:MAG TPA: transglutaminase family protein [Xanthobacteraceae bacterium]|nr:transglutaminase family protein [Xanthobacteraceae bacterium]
MRIRVAHETVYRYDTPATNAIQILRLWPRNYDGQYVVRWRVEVSEDCHVEPREDAFGNLTHTFTVDGPISELSVRVAGEVETQNTHGIIRGTREKFPPSLYLRPTDLTLPDAAISAWANEVADGGKRPALDTLHALSTGIYETFRFDAGSTLTTTTAAEAFAQKHGVCQDFAHVFSAAARHLGIPSRYVGGYFQRSDGIVETESGHAWAEAWLPDLGWIAFDPAHGMSADDAYIRVAIGLDCQGAAPVRGNRRGGIGEKLDVKVVVDQAGRQAQQ